MTVITEDFLRRNTLLVGGGNYSYLYRILPPDQRGKGAWAHGHELLPGGGFESPGDFGPTGWQTVGNPRLDLGGVDSHSGHGAILLAAGNALHIDAPVTANTQYLFSSASLSAKGYGGFQMSIE